MANLVEEFQRSWLTSLIGLGLFATGVWLLTWNEVIFVYFILNVWIKINFIGQGRASRLFIR